MLCAICKKYDACILACNNWPPRQIPTSRTWQRALSSHNCCQTACGKQEREGCLPSSRTSLVGMPKLHSCASCFVGTSTAPSCMLHTWLWWMSVAFCIGNTPSPQPCATISWWMPQMQCTWGHQLPPAWSSWTLGSYGPCWERPLPPSSPMKHQGSWCSSHPLNWKQKRWNKVLQHHTKMNLIYATVMTDQIIDLKICKKNCTYTMSVSYKPKFQHLFMWHFTWIPPSACILSSNLYTNWAKWCKCWSSLNIAQRGDWD